VVRISFYSVSFRLSTGKVMVACPSPKKCSDLEDGLE
jgi:hypothetical protein